MRCVRTWVPGQLRASVFLLAGPHRVVPTTRGRSPAPAGPRIRLPSTAWPSRAAGAAARPRDPAALHRVAESVKNLLLCPRRAWSALGNAEALLTT